MAEAASGACTPVLDGCTGVHVETCARLVFSTQLINASRE